MTDKWVLSPAILACNAEGRGKFALGQLLAERQFTGDDKFSELGRRRSAR
nr:hypothetical protein [Pararhizobium capsulatum]